MNIENTQPISNFNVTDYVFSIGNHKEQKVIWVNFPYSVQLLKNLKSVATPKWSAQIKAWYVTYSKNYLNLFQIDAPIVGKDVFVKIHPNNLKAFEDFQNILLLKAYSQNTLKTYSIEFAQLLYILKDFPVENLTPEKLKSYFLYCIKELGLSENYLHSRINAVKFYFEKVLKRDKLFFDIPRPKKALLLPKVLNTNEIEKMIAHTENLKHRIILKLCYGMGLRVSEIVKLKIEDIDGKKRTVLISRAKGKKDRYVNLPASILDELRAYYKLYKPTEFLFEGQFGGTYSIRSAQSVFKVAMKKAGIRKNIGIHSLRHSFATHLLEYGTDISLIQKLMGHNDIKTTLAYTHITDKNIAKVVAPLDKL